MECEGHGDDVISCLSFYQLFVVFFCALVLQVLHTTRGRYLTALACLFFFS